MIQIRVRKTARYNNLKRKRSGCIRLKDELIGRTVVVLTYQEYATLLRVAKNRTRTLNKIRKLL